MSTSPVHYLRHVVVVSPCRFSEILLHVLHSYKQHPCTANIAKGEHKLWLNLIVKVVKVCMFMCRK